MNLYRINKSVIHEWWLCLFQLWRLFITYSCQRYKDVSLREQNLFFFFWWDLLLNSFWWSVAFQPHPVDVGYCREDMGDLECYFILNPRRERVSPLGCFANIYTLVGNAGMVCLDCIHASGHDSYRILMGAHSSTDKFLCIGYFAAYTCRH